MTHQKNLKISVKLLPIKNWLKHPGKPKVRFWQYIGPGLLVTVGFIDPGNWAANISAGSYFGYALLWMVTLSTLMLIILQHNAAHLGMVTGLCISEAASIYLKSRVSRSLLTTAIMASVSTALAEILGGALALQMLFKIPLALGACLMFIFVLFMLFNQSYKRLEKWIIGFVSLIGFSFVFELGLVHLPGAEILKGWVVPSFPPGSLPIIMSVLGAVIMPHNLFLHSEIIQSRQWCREPKKVMKHKLKFEFFDTMFSMIIGWAINSAMIILAASVFFRKGIRVTELQQAHEMLHPLLGPLASLVFALALLFSGLSSSVTAGMAGGSIFSGLFKEPYAIKDNHTRLGIFITLVGAVILILFIRDPFKALVISQMLLSLQLPFTIFLLIYLTSKKKVMGEYANPPGTRFLLLGIGLIVTTLNIMLLIQIAKNILI